MKLLALRDRVLSVTLGASASTVGLRKGVGDVV
jgi:hypothetical protein